MEKIFYLKDFLINEGLKYDAKYDYFYNSYDTDVDSVHDSIVHWITHHLDDYERNHKNKDVKFIFVDQDDESIKISFKKKTKKKPIFSFIISTEDLNDDVDVQSHMMDIYNIFLGHRRIAKYLDDSY